jgi:hypothetical protein
MEAAAYTEAEEALSLTESVSRREVGVGGGVGWGLFCRAVTSKKLEKFTGELTQCIKYVHCTCKNSEYDTVKDKKH